MNHLFARLCLLISVLLCSPHVFAQKVWNTIRPGGLPAAASLFHPTHFSAYAADTSALKAALFNVSANPGEATIISLPQPDGSFRHFKVWETPVLPPALAARIPQIRTFSGTAVDNPAVTAKLDYTLFGFHAMVYDGGNTVLIDPYSGYNDGLYIVRYKSDETATESTRMRCEVHGENGIAAKPATAPLAGHAFAARTTNGYQLRKYRLALAANNHYCRAAPMATTIAAALSKMTTTINRVNGVYERELAITLEFAANETNIIWPTAIGSPNGPDPFDDINSNAVACLTKNQEVCDDRIGVNNYDIGHVFTTGAGGLSLLGNVCQAPYKAQSVTGSANPTGDGFNIDYVAHEIGHEFGSDHTFNNNSSGSCAGNAVRDYSYEPGSGSTIMAYAGICSPDNVQQHSDAYFHISSLTQIHEYAMNGPGNSCAIKSETGNKLVGIGPFTSTYSIPYLTPFELTAPVAVDSANDSVILYCWEQWDKGGSEFGRSFANTLNDGPIFRSYPPSTSNIRVFPRISKVIAGTLNDAGTDNAQGEKVPEVARTMKFRCTYRNIRNNIGSFTLPDDSVMINSVITGTGAGFKVTSQGTSGINYLGGSTQTITWTVLNTNVPPINSANVKIYMSINAGQSWDYLMATVPNNGSASVIVPNPANTSNEVRFKVKGSNNVFFNVNGANITVEHNPSVPVTPPNPDSATAVGISVNIFPVPAHNVVHIVTENSYDGTVFDAVGRKLWQGTITGNTDIPTYTWARGHYILILFDKATGKKTIKRLVIG